MNYFIYHSIYLKLSYQKNYFFEFLRNPFELKILLHTNYEKLYVKCVILSYNV